MQYLSMVLDTTKTALLSHKMLSAPHLGKCSNLCKREVKTPADSLSVGAIISIAANACGKISSSHSGLS